MIRGLLLCVLVVPAGADTVFLNNGTAIDGLIKARHEQTLELQIGKIGRIFVELDKIESIEKNERDGSASDASIVLTGKRRLVEEAESTVAETTKPAAAALDKPKDKRIRTKDDVDTELRAEIERQIYDFTREKRKFRVRATQRLTEVGDAALPFLLEVAAHENPQVRIAVMEIFTQNGTDLVVKDVIDRLDDQNEYVRKTANEALVKITGKDFGFKFDAVEDNRREQVGAWRKWYTALKEEEAAEARKAAEAQKAAAESQPAEGTEEGAPAGAGAKKAEDDGAGKPRNDAADASQSDDPAVSHALPKPGNEAPIAPSDEDREEPATPAK